METTASTSSKSKVNGDESMSILSTLPTDMLANIIVHLPIGQWPTLEIMDEHFRAATLIAWRQLRNLDLDREILIRPDKEKDLMEFGKSVVAILRELAERSPFLTSISGLEIPLYYADLNSLALRSLAQFEHLESITMDQRGLPLDNAVRFLENTQSRTNLKELRLSVELFAADRATILDRFVSSFANGREIGSPLKLETFSFTSSYHAYDPSLFIRLDTMNATRLTDCRLGKTPIEPQQLTDLIERASNLRRLEFSFLFCPAECKGPRLLANKILLAALATRENLEALKFDRCPGPARCPYSKDTECVDFFPEFIETLKLIGRRGKLRKLAMEYYFVPPSTINMEEICATICTYIPYLQAIKIYTAKLTDESVCNIAGLAELEEINFISWSSRVSPNAMKKIVQQPQLKRLAFFEFIDEDMDSLKCLASATALTDLRIWNADLISANVFEKWSEADGFASNLEILMLGRIAVEYNKRAEEGLVLLLEKAVRLRVLILDGNITDRSLTAIAQSCPELETIGIRSFSNQIKVRSLQEVLDRCSRLKRLGGFGDGLRKRLRLPEYRKIGEVDMHFWAHDFDDGEYE